MKAKKIILIEKFCNFPKLSNFKIVEEDLPQITDGEYLVEAVYLSVDPYMRSFPTPTGSVVLGGQVAKIIESKSEEYPVGQYVFGKFGWRTHTIISQAPEGRNYRQSPYILKGFGELPSSLALGVLGMPGNTAYFGLLEICQPKEGETVVVSAAAGAVGSIAGQIAKIQGCRVIGIVGSDAKGEWITKELGFDHFINYNKPNLRDAIKRVAINGVDCYFDNVGGEISSVVLSTMNFYGRVACCGAISQYNSDIYNLPKVTVIQGIVVVKQLKLEGFIVNRWLPRWLEGIKQNLKWIQEGKLKYKETITKGFENMPQALIGIFEGENYGKAIVEV